MTDSLIFTRFKDALLFIFFKLAITSIFNFFFKKVKYCNILYNIYVSLMILYILVIPINYIIKLVNITFGIYIILIILYYISTLFKKNEEKFSNKDQLTPHEIIQLCDNYHSNYEDYESSDLSETDEIINYSFKKSNNIKLDNKYIVSKIISHQGYGKNLKFYVNWEGYSHNDNTYEPLKNLKDCTVLHNYVRRNRDLHYLKEKLGI